MARLPRLVVPGCPHWVLQRAHGGRAVFVDDEDRAHFLAQLQVQAATHRMEVHAYVLLPDGYQLLATPADDAGLARFVQAVGRAYVRHYNDRHACRGTLWEGRFRSTPVEAEHYLLTCMALLDLSPVRAGVAAEPGAYPWSSHAHYLGRRVDRLVRPHAAYWALGNTPFAREAAYAERVRAGLGESQWAELMHAVQGGWALGRPAFVAELQKSATRRVHPGRPGRPAARAAGQ